MNEWLCRVITLLEIQISYIFIKSNQYYMLFDKSSLSEFSYFENKTVETCF